MKDEHTVVFSSDDLPERRLQLTQVFVSRYRDLGEAMALARRQMIQKLAHAIGEDDRFIKVVPDDGMTVALRADVVVVTTDELRALLLQKFKEGVNHATSFMPVPYAQGEEPTK